MTNSWDVFFSYRRHDLERAQPLLDALAEAGVRVWRDESENPEQASITEEIRRGIAQSKGLLAFYSLTYPLSSACQQELAAAWLAAQQMDGIANRRVWVINPESGFEHVPELLRDQQSGFLKAGATQLAQTVKNRLAALDATLLGVGVRGLPAYRV